MKLFLFTLSIVISIQAFAGDYVFVAFTDKCSEVFEPESFFDEKAIERRELQGLPAFDWYDLPVCDSYINQVAFHCDSLGYTSRWLNGVFAHTNAISDLQSMPFVKEVLRMNSQVQVAEHKEETESAAFWNDPEYMEDLASYQVERLGYSELKDAGLDGSGVRIAVFDVGFAGMQNHPAFSHLYQHGQIVKTWDFVRNREKVYSHGYHGTSVMGCIAGQMRGQALGLAPAAEFLLARTERGIFEPQGEEENWIAAAEWADKHGASIINSSLAYTNQRYFAFQMDGKSSLVSRGAEIAAQKGILIVNAAGNEGDIFWRVVGAPADAESVLTVGGTDPYTDAVISFSSLGPTADKRKKPNLSAPGMVVSATKSSYRVVNGTSFSAPLVTGFAACALQKFPDMKGKDFFDFMESTGHLYPYFDYAHGHGVPQAAKMLAEPLADTTFEMSAKPYKVFVKFDDQFLKITDTTITVDPPKNLYFSVVNEDGTLQEYKVIRVTKPKFSIYYTELLPSPPVGKMVRLHFEGYTETQKIPSP